MTKANRKDDSTTEACHPYAIPPPGHTCTRAHPISAIIHNTRILDTPPCPLRFPPPCTSHRCPVCRGLRWFHFLPSSRFPASPGGFEIGVIASSTGVTAVVGMPQKNTVALLPTEIGGQKVEYIVLDDASDPTHAVTDVRKLISEHKVDALIGPTTTPAALAMLDFVARSKTPLVTPSARRRWCSRWTTRRSGYSRRRRTTT